MPEIIVLRRRYYMKTVQLPLLVILFLIVLTVKDSSATNFNPSNYEIKNWLEVPGGGSIWGERRLQYITKDDLFTQLGRKKDGSIY